MEERFSAQQKEFLQFLQFLEECRVLEHIIVCGSWAEFIYAQTGILPGFTLLLRTLDIDFLEIVPEEISAEGKNRFDILKRGICESVR